MQINERSQTLPAGYGGTPSTSAASHAATPASTHTAAARAATLPAVARPGSSRRASNPVPRSTPSSAVGYSIRYLLAGKQQRAAMHAARARSRFADSMQEFIKLWSQRQIDELSPREGAKLLATVCKRALPLHGGRDLSAMTAIQRDCLSALDDPTGLLMLYSDRDATRELAGRQAGKLRPVATGILDTLEQALTETLAGQTGDSLFDRLLRTVAYTHETGCEMRATLEQLHGIAVWLSSPTRPAARVLARMLDRLRDQELGRLAAQAWPDLSVQDERYGADPAQMDAALAFIEACQGEALEIWREALGLQLDERKRVIARHATSMVASAISMNRLRDGMRASYRHLEDHVRALTGLLPHTSVLSARARVEALTMVIHRLPEEMRQAGLRSLHARDLHQLKSSQDMAPGRSTPDASISTTVETVQIDMLCADRRAFEDALAGLHESIAVKDRTVAVTRLGGLARALEELSMTQEAFNTAMPAKLTASLEHVTVLMRGLLLGVGHRADDGTGGSDGGGSSGSVGENPLAREVRALRGMSDIELGVLRTAVPALSPFGALIDKRALKSVIQTRCRIPRGADRAMHALADTLTHPDAGIIDVFAGLRDLAGILLQVNRRRDAMGEDISADSNGTLVEDVARPVMDRLVRYREGSGIDRKHAVRELPGITGETLCGPLFQLAEWSASQPPEELARLNVSVATLTIAGHMERYLHATMTNHDGDAAGVDARTGSGARGDEVHFRRAGFNSVDAARAAIAGQFGVEWDAAANTARPCITREFHGLLEQRFAVPRADSQAQLRPIDLHASDGRPSWFSVSAEFAYDMLDRTGMALAVEGVNPQGVAVYSPGFSVHLDKDARLAALGTAMHALRDLAGADLPALTVWMHRGIFEAFADAVAASPQGLPLHLPNGMRAGMPTAAPDATEFLVRREADGRYTIETVLTWTGIASLPLIDGLPAAELSRASGSRASADRSSVGGGRASVDRLSVSGSRTSVDRSPVIGDRTSVNRSPVIGGRTSVNRSPVIGGRASVDRPPVIGGRTSVNRSPVSPGSDGRASRMSVQSMTVEMDTVALDPARSRITVAFALAADTRGVVSGLRETVDLRYQLAVLQ